jgi:phosphate transport system substrate-binding protein
MNNSRERKRRINFFAMALVGFLLAIVLFGCGGGKGRSIPGDDTPTSGTIQISVDESFKPIIDSQIKVFMALFPQTHVIPHYKPEAECLKDLTNDSIRMVIVTRGLSEEEVKYLKDTLEFAPIWDKIASDAIAVIVNNKAKDSLFDMSDIRSLMNGTSGYKLKPILDGKKATSTVRFMLDSVLRGAPISPDVAGADSSQGVIDYVGQHEDAIGFVGVSWVGDLEDPQQLHFVNKVRVASIEARGEKGKYIKPYQANIATKRYPMTRGLYYIVKENYGGLGRGFANFMQFERGQLIFRKAYLVPAKMDFSVRDARITEGD